MIKRQSFCNIWNYLPTAVRESQLEKTKLNFLTYWWGLGWEAGERKAFYRIIGSLELKFFNETVGDTP